jgi:hypothetical protein
MGALYNKPVPRGRAKAAREGPGINLHKPP